MPQEFLASFAVDIDEGGVTRLQTILSQNRELAESLASAFSSAREEMELFLREAAEGFDTLPFASEDFQLRLDLTQANKQLKSFFESAKKQMRLSADASGIVSAVSSALSRAQSLAAATVLKIRTEIEQGGGSSSGTGGTKPASPVVFAATGGRFSAPTVTEIAEDGDPEYVIPVKKEGDALPLIRSMLGELSASAREALRGALPGPGVTPGEAGGSPLRTFLPYLSDVLSVPSVSPVLQQRTENNVQAPVNIRVEASAADPVAVGQSIYDTAEHYLLRTLQRTIA